MTPSGRTKVPEVNIVAAPADGAGKPDAPIRISESSLGRMLGAVGAKTAARKLISDQ
jgi:hypothetical protein